MPEERIAFPTVARDVYRAIAALSQSVELDAPLRELINLRASHLNGCAFCLDMHATAALKGGEQERRIWAVSAWREAPFFDARERAAFALTDAMTLLPEAGVPDDVWNEAARHFSPEELGNVMGAVVTINSWNRVVLASGMQPPPLEAPATAAASASA